MGNCTSPIKKLNKKNKEKQKSSFLRNVNLPKLLNLLRSSEIDLIDEKIQQVCINEKKKLLNYQLFQQLFPNLQMFQKNVGSAKMKSFFELFDQTNDGYIDSREVINGIALIQFIQDNRFGELLAKIFNLVGSDNLIPHKRFEDFKKSNQKFQLPLANQNLSVASKDQVANRPSENTLQSFCQYIKKNYNIQQYRLLFDLFQTNLEKDFIKMQQRIQKYEEDENKEKILGVESGQQMIKPESGEQIGQTNVKIKSFDKEQNLQQQHEMNEKMEQNKLVFQIKKNEPAYLVDIKWFNTWRLYLKRYDVIQIEFLIEGVEIKDKQNKFKLSIDELKDKSKYVRPSKFENYQLFGEFQGQLKYKLEIQEIDNNQQQIDKYLDLEKRQLKLEIFKDFVVFPKNIWQILKKIYRGGPDIQRKVPYFYPLFIYRVYTENGVFIKQKILKYIISVSYNIGGILDEKDIQEKLIYLSYTQLIGEQTKTIWKLIDLDFMIPQDQLQRRGLNHQFITIINKSQQSVFQSNYNGNLISNPVQTQFLMTHNSLPNNGSNKIINSDIIKNKKFLIGYGQYVKIKLEKIVLKSEQFIQKEDINPNNPEIFENNAQQSKKFYWARVIELKKDGVKVHYINKSYGCDYFFTYKQIQQIKESKLGQYVPVLRNIIPAFKHKIKINGNELKLSYLFSIVQCLIATPYFLDFLIKRKFKYNLNKNLNFKNTVLRQLANLAIQSKDMKSDIDYENFYYLFTKKVGQLSQSKKSFDREILPDQFLSALLDQIDTEIRQSLEQKQKKVTSTKETKDQTQSEKQIEITRQKQNKKLNQNQQQIQIQSTSQNKDNKVGEEEITNNKEKQVIKKFFQFEGNKTTNCIECGNVNIQKDMTYILNLKINQDDQVLFKGYFYPWKHGIEKKGKQYKKFLYGATMKLSKEFYQLANQFLFQIKKLYPQVTSLKNLHFALQKSGEFRKHFEGEDFKSTLQFLNLKKDHIIMIYQVREIDNDTIEEEKLESSSMQLNHSRQIEQREEEKTTTIQNRNRDQFLKKTQFSKYEYVDYKIYLDWQVAQFIQKDGNKYAKIKNYEYREPARIELHKILPLGTKTSQKQSLKIEIIHRKEQDKKILRDLNIKPFIVCIKQLTKINDIEKMIKNQMGRYKVKSNYAQVGIKKKKSQRISAQQDIQYSKVSIQDYEIKYLKKMAGDACIFCGKKSRIYSKNMNKSQNIEADIDKKKYCYGNSCSILNSEIREAPIGCYVDLKKLFIVIDWRVQVYENAPEEDQSFRQAKNYIDNHFTTIDESFKQLEGKSDKDFICKACKYVQANCRKYITTIPNILIIKLQRFIKLTTGIQKLDNKIQIKQEISLAMITNPVNNQDLYQLYAIVCHRGSSLQEGSWYSYILRSRKYWIKCDDNVTYCEDVKHIKHSEICMLFYRRKNIEGYLVSLVI